MEQEWEKQGGFGPVVLVEVGSQLSQCEVELGSDRLARAKAFRQPPACHDVFPDPFVLCE
jgi:hypothetical protein